MSYGVQKCVLVLGVLVWCCLVSVVSNGVGLSMVVKSGVVLCGIMWLQTVVWYCV